MDRFRKTAAQVRIQCRFLKVAYWQYEPKKDFYRLVNDFLVMSGIWYDADTPLKWIAWNCYNAVSVCHYFLTLTHFIEALMDWPNLVPVIWNFVEFFMMCTALCKSAVLRRHMSVILETQQFINDRTTSCGYEKEDLKARESLFKMIQILPGSMFAVIGTVVVLTGIAIGPDDLLFGQSQFFHRHLSGWKARIVHMFLNSHLFPIWVGKTYCSTILLSCLLMGMKTELTLFMRRFCTVCERFDGSGVNAFKEQLALCVYQHVRILDQLRQLHPLVKSDFLVIYYGGLVTIGSLIFIPTTDGLSIGSFILTLGIMAFFIECYLWCWLVESFKVINDTIEEQIMQVIVKIPYNPEEHSEYIRLRTSLMIMIIGARYSAKFNCGGVFNITIEAVGKLLNITYSLVAFLLNFT